MSNTLRFALIGLLVPALARAQVVIGFDDRPGMPPPYTPGTTIAPQYFVHDEYAGLGVVFDSGGGGIVITAAANPVSSPNSVAATSAGPVLSYADPVTATFVLGGSAAVVDSVAVTLSNSSSPSRLEAYDEAGSLLGSSIGSAAAQLAVSFPGRIHSVVIQQGPMAFDDFTFDGLAPTWQLGSIEPASGSEAGGDLLRIFGTRLDSLAAPAIRVGGATASIVSTSADVITVLTPAGVGTADVTVSTGSSSRTLAGAFLYVARDVASRYGNVNATVGPRSDVLLVNASAGDPLLRETSLHVGQSIRIVATTPPSRSTARFAIYAWGRAPDAATRTDLPRGLGAMCLPPPFVGGAPRVVWNNAGHRATLGAPTLPSTPAPSILVSRNAVPAPIVFTIQGVIQDDASAHPSGWSVTNAVVTRVVP
jgi:IPT/TIG domain-containing protein